MSDAEGEEHPTRGGLRIGKALPERGPKQAYDERLEWDRDGQYFHYLTRWMHALDLVARATRQPIYNQWARELALTACHAFSHGTSVRRLYWKMSIDLTRPLVPSMGQHDPLDGYITCLQLQTTAHSLREPNGDPGLEAATRQFAEMIKRGLFATADPLGLGGLMCDAYRVQQLLLQGTPTAEGLLDSLLAAASNGIPYFVQGGDLQQPASFRLGFRELGLAIGLQAIGRMWRSVEGHPKLSSQANLGAVLHGLMHYAPLGREIETFWRNPEHQAVTSWLEHRDINDVMLATLLRPDGYLTLN